MKALIGGLAALAVAGVVAGCGSSGVSASLDPIARAAATTSQLGGAQLSFDMRVSSPKLPQVADVTGNGFVNTRTHEAHLQMTVPNVPAGQTMTMTMLLKPPYAYINEPLLAQFIPGGKQWIRIDASKGSLAGVGAGNLPSSGMDPTQGLEYLKAVGAQATNLGTATVQGVTTTHYRATVSLDRLAAVARVPGAAHAVQELESFGVSSFPVDVWVDSQHRVRQEQFSYLFTKGPAADTSTVMTIDFTSFGPTPAVTPPPASETMDATGLLAGMSSATQSR